MYLGQGRRERIEARQAAREERVAAREQRRGEIMAGALVRRMREPVSATETQELPTAPIPVMPQIPSEQPAAPQAPYGMPVEMETTAEPAIIEPTPADGGIMPLLLGGGLLLLLLA